VAAPLGALRDDDVGAGFGRADGFRHGSGHVSDEAAHFVGALEISSQVLLRPRPGELHDRRSQLKGSGKTVFPCVEEKKIQSERLVRLLANGGGSLPDLLRAQVMATERSEPSGIGYGGNELGRGGRSHAA